MIFVLTKSDADAVMFYFEMKWWSIVDFIVIFPSYVTQKIKNTATKSLIRSSFFSSFYLPRLHEIIGKCLRYLKNSHGKILNSWVRHYSLKFYCVNSSDKLTRDAKSRVKHTTFQ